MRHVDKLAPCLDYKVCVPLNRSRINQKLSFLLERLDLELQFAVHRKCDSVGKTSKMRLSSNFKPWTNNYLSKANQFVIIIR